MAVTKRRGYVPQDIEPKWQRVWDEDRKSTRLNSSHRL